MYEEKNSFNHNGGGNGTVILTANKANATHIIG